MNKVILCGRLTAKPELRYTESNKAYCRFTIAINRPRIKDKEQEVDFINCISWGEQGETITKYFDKGNKILIEGRVQTNKYQDKDGNNKVSFDINVDKFYFVDDKKQSSDTKAVDKKDDNINSDPFEDFGNDIDNMLE